MRTADWYFDFISPYAYLQFQRLEQLPAGLDLRLRPVLFAGLLDHWGQLGPAEIPQKKVHTLLLTRRRAQAMGVPFVPPPRHPFNPLPLLRLALALGSERAAVRAIFHHIWGEGRDGQTPESLNDLAAKLGVDDLAAATGVDAVKAQLRTNTEEAAARGVFGVPSFVIEDRVFWGDDSFELMLEWLENPSVLDDAEIQRILTLAPAAERARKT